MDDDGRRWSVASGAAAASTSSGNVFVSKRAHDRWPSQQQHQQTSPPRLTSHHNNSARSFGHAEPSRAPALLRKVYDALWSDPSASLNTPDLLHHQRAASSEHDWRSFLSAASRRRALSPLGWILVMLLLLLGVRELWVSVASPKPVAVTSRSSSRLRSVSPHHPKRDLDRYFPILDTAGQAKTWIRQQEDEEDVFNEQGDTTAVVLHWKRTDNVRLIVAHLCQFTFFKTVMVWNNNPDMPLSMRTFASSGCPAGVLRIHNSPKNMLFFGRFLACSMTATPYCYVQDDDWLVSSVRAMYAQFKRDPAGPIVVNSDERTSGMYALEWCFFNQPMHTCFAWLGTGAFMSKWQVQMFVATATALPFGIEELQHADNYFSVFQNEPPYVLTSSLSPLPIKAGYSEGSGIRRNKEHIHRGISYVMDLLNVSSANVELRNSPATDVKLYQFQEPQAPPVPAHPHAHHARYVDEYDVTFLTNVHMLPSPSAIMYPGADAIGFENWENHLGHLARGWMEGNEVYREEESWYMRHHYGNVFATASSGNKAWRSPDVIKRGDYVALGLLSRIEIHWHTSMVISWETVDVVPLAYEISIDGVSWDPAHVVQEASCKPTRSIAQPPDPPFPPIHGLSSAAQRVRDRHATLPGTGGLSKLWRAKRRWTRCQVVVDSSIGYTAGDFGWRFFRMKANEDQDEIGWAMRAFSIKPQF